MIHSKFLLLVAIQFLLFLTATGQSIERSVIGSTGGYFESTDYSLSQTVGEVAIETKTNGTIILTQGFQQPDSDQGVNVDELQLELSYNVYPNPTSDFLNIALKSSSNFSGEIYLTDMKGQQITGTKSVSVGANFLTEKIDVSTLATASYIVIIKDEVKIIKAIKIQVIR